MLFQEVTKAYVAYRESSFDILLKCRYQETKKKFRNQKRFNIKLKKDKQLQRLNDLLRLNKNSFWNKLKNMKKCVQNIDVSIEQLKHEYEVLFNEKNIINTSSGDEIELENLLNEHRKNKKCDYKVDEHKLAETIKSLPNGKAIGFAELSNEMLKYNNSEKVTRAIKIICEIIINYVIIPKLFNTSIIKPTIKDST